MINFRSLLERQGYEVTEKSLAETTVDRTILVIAKKENETFRYLLKQYQSKEYTETAILIYDLLSSEKTNKKILYRHGNEIAYDFVSWQTRRE